MEAEARRYEEVRDKARADFLAYAQSHMPADCHPAAWYAHHEGIFDAINPPTQAAFPDMVTAPFRRHGYCPSPEHTHYLDALPDILRTLTPAPLRSLSDAKKYAKRYGKPPR